MSRLLVFSAGTPRQSVLYSTPMKSRLCLLFMARLRVGVCMRCLLRFFAQKGDALSGVFPIKSVFFLSEKVLIFNRIGTDDEAYRTGKRAAGTGEGGILLTQILQCADPVKQHLSVVLQNSGELSDAVAVKLRHAVL